MSHQRNVSVIGLGYVGLPVAVAMAKHNKTIGFDINQARVKALQEGHDETLEVASDELNHPNLVLTSESSDLQQADFHIVAVPTPINNVKQPDLSPLESASSLLGKQLKKGDIVVYESTVYPGATEEVCVPILERESGLSCGTDFKVGYSPERINPGDEEHVFTNITKVVSGQDQESLDIIAAVYGSVVTAGVYKASTIKVAEAAKVIENTQRDLNIALMNELAIIFNKLGIDTQDVLDAASTKWNFLRFNPGLVGGHCIGVDPYYLTHKAKQIGYRPQVIQAGRRINDGMGKFIVEQTIKQLILKGAPIKGAKVAVLGLTFKENCPDLRNSKVEDVINELREYGIEPLVHDPMADPQQAFNEYKVELVNWESIQDVDVVIACVAHDQYQQLKVDEWQALYKNKQGILVDVKAFLERKSFADTGITVWRL